LHSNLYDIVCFSKRRREVLFLLNEKSRDIDEIKENMGVSSNSILPEIKKMKEIGLMEQNDRHYVLSKIGKPIVAKLKSLHDICSLFGTNAEYWKNHDLSSIPEELLYQMDIIGECDMIQLDYVDPFKACQVHIDHLNRSNDIKAIFMFVHPSYPSIFANLAQRGIKISLIVTKDVLEILKMKYKEEFDIFITEQNSCVFLIDENMDPCCISITDTFLGLFLPNKSGIYDRKPIFSFTTESLKWGEKLFNHYLQKSNIVDIETLDN
jgi:predicted transcriptional regulator